MIGLFRRKIIGICNDLEEYFDEIRDGKKYLSSFCEIVRIFYFNRILFLWFYK